MQTQIQAIKQFLAKQDKKLDLFTPDMEVQVLTDKEAKPFRIPYNSGTEPTYTDKLISFDFDRHVLAIGLTGWDWRNKVSRWVGFDFDSISGHNKGLTDAEFDDLRDRIKEIDWITSIRSKSGKGLHLYVHLDQPVPTENHNEHSGLARAILSNLSSLLNFNFFDKVDCVGSVLWIWHAEAKEYGFTAVKSGTTLKTIPSNWREQINVKGRNRRIPDRFSDNEDEYKQLLQKTKQLNLDDDHRTLLTWFANQEIEWWFDAEKNMLVCHTYDLKRAHNELSLKGIFETDAIGKDVPNDQNCFAFPIRNGGWVVRRHSPGTQEHPYWYLDNSGWRTAYFNRLPDLQTASRMHGGVKTKKGDIYFNEYQDAAKALKLLGSPIQYDASLGDRECWLSSGSLDNELVITLERYKEEGAREGWASVRGPKWEQTTEYNSPPIDVEPPDQLVRHCINQGRPSWFVNTSDKWTEQNKDNVKSLLKATGYKSHEIEVILGKSIANHWDIKTIPFEVEFPGDRIWNRDAPALAATPKAGPTPYWNKVLDHIGENVPVNDNQWCRLNGVVTGRQYLELWLASMLQFPDQPLPYLFIFGDENCGKSILQESVDFLITKGRVDAKDALLNQRGFNANLDGAVFCYVEEIDITRNEEALSRIKEWTTNRDITIHPTGKDVYRSRNYTHWIQTANYYHYCPVFPGDTRITVIQVNTLTEEIPRHFMDMKLKEETPFLLDRLLKKEIPPTDGRLRIPVIDSNIKVQLEQSNVDALKYFINNYCTYDSGAIISFNDFYTEFLKSVDQSEMGQWSKISVGRKFPITEKYPRGRYGNGGHNHIGNMRVENVPTNKLNGKIKVNRSGKLYCETTDASTE